MTLRKYLLFAGFVSAALLTACGGGGGSSPVMPATAAPTNQPNTPTPAPTQTPVPLPVVAGKIVSIPLGTYGTSAPQSPLSGATVIVGTTLILGVTPPPTLPAGDVQATTDANGNYSVQMTSAQVAPNAANGLFVKPVLDLSGVTPPTLGYYVSVFPSGVDGKSAGAPLPVHSFSAVMNNTLVTQRVTVASSDEASHLALVNAARIKYNPTAPAFFFDETAEETARLHANDLLSQNQFCHFDAMGVGPQSRYLKMLGLGTTDENLGGGSGTMSYIEQAVIGLFMAEGPGGGHYNAIVDPSESWSGVSTVSSVNGVQFMDEEFINPQGHIPYVSGVTTGSVCASGTPNNS